MGKLKYIMLGILGAILLLAIVGGIYIYVNFFMASPLAVLVVDQGTVQYKTEAGEWKNAANGMELKQGYSVKTLEDSLAKIIFSNSVMRLDSGTEVRLDNLDKEKVTLTQMVGRTWNRLLKISGINDYEVSTPNAIASVRGTGFAVVYDGKNTEVKVADGTVNVDSMEDGQKKASAQVEGNKELKVEEGKLDRLNVEALKEDDWIVKNRGLDEQHKQEMKQNILKKYGMLINTVKSQYGMTDAQLDDLFEKWYNGEMSVKKAIADGKMPSELARLIPEEFKRY